MKVESTMNTIRKNHDQSFPFSISGLNDAARPVVEGHGLEERVGRGPQMPE